jgi:hypothetical protein
VAYPFIWYEDGLYYLFYLGFTATGYAGGTKRICLATSPDLATWTRRGAIISPSGAGWRQSAVWHPYVIKRGSTYYLFFNGNTLAGFGGVGYATSADLLTWTVDDANSPVIDKTALAWDSSFVADANFYRIGDTWYANYFGGNGTLGQQGLAFTSDADFPLGWTKFSGNPVLPVGAGGTFDDTNAGRGGVWTTGHRFYQWYTSNDGSSPAALAIAYAVDASIDLERIANNTLLANISGATAAPVATTFGSITGIGSALKWTTARTLSFTGAATGSGSLDGSADLPIALSLASIATGNLLANTSGSAAAPIATPFASITGVGSAAKWATARTLTLTGDAVGSASVDGSANVSLGVTLSGEAVQDIVGGFVVAGSGMTITYDDGSNTLTFASTGSGAGGGAGTDLFNQSFIGGL